MGSADLANFQTLYTYLGTPTFQDKIKEALTLYWNDITNVTNEANFNARGSGYRNELGVFSGLKQNGPLIAINGVLRARLDLTSGSHSAAVTTSVDYNLGHGIRPIKTTTTLTDGPGIHWQRWQSLPYHPHRNAGMAATTLPKQKFRNGEYIHGYEGALYANFK